MRDNHIGHRIKKIRENKNFTQEYMSQRLNISQNTYSLIESGSSKLTTDRLKEISTILEVPVESIITEDFQTYNFTNSHIEKFYGYIETLQEENKELTQKLSDQITHLQTENQKLLSLVETLTQKIK